jgi:predicted acylesterase/phospholipase RssA
MNTSHDPPGPLHISMTLPGSASLGAFQAGAVAALSVVVNTLRRAGRPVHLDAIGGSSAGAIVSMLLTHCLLTGRDAPALLRDAWVDEVNVKLLRSGGHESPLAFDDLRTRMEDFLGDLEAHPENVHEPLERGVSVHVSLTSLLGLTVPVSTGEGETDTIDYADWISYDLEPGGDFDDLAEPAGRSLLDAVLVSASHPGAFPPRTFDRSPDRELYEALGVRKLPEDMNLWYTDGGLVESKPVGRVVRAARNRDDDEESTRLHLVVDPRSSGPSGADEWASSESDLGWLDGVQRSLSILPTQALHDDLREIAETNARLDRLHEVIEVLQDRLGAELDDDLLEQLAEMADLRGKQRIGVEMITPLLLADDDEQGVTDLLAGDFIGAFGGFLDRRIRRNDFALGWACTTRWVGERLGRYGADDDVCDDVLSALDEEAMDDWADARLSADGIGQLDRVGQWQLFLLAVRTGRVLASKALPSPARAFDRFRHDDG